MKMLVDAITKDITDNWDSNKIHVQAHSSGYDSRLLSQVIKNCAAKYGSDWLGEIYFICWQPEIDQFLKIMEYEGWDEKHIITVRPDDAKLDYFAEAINFGVIGNIRRAHRFIIRCFDYFLDREIAKLGNNIQLISGLWSDEVLRKGKIWKTKAELKQYMIDDIHFDWNMYDTILPFASDGFIDVFSSSGIELKPDEVKVEMIKYLDPGLVELENYRFEYWKIMKATGTHPIYMISSKTQASAQKEYDNSKYKIDTGININIPNYISNKHDAWKHYMKAAMYEITQE